MRLKDRLRTIREALTGPQGFVTTDSARYDAQYQALRTAHPDAYISTVTEERPDDDNGGQMTRFYYLHLGRWAGSLAEAIARLQADLVQNPNDEELTDDLVALLKAQDNLRKKAVSLDVLG